jgi:hypothetical protein
MTRMTFIAATLTLAVTLPSAPANATGAPRTFLSAAGLDTNNCINVATPCRHLAAAYAATAPNGEIYVLDPANYGSLTIDHGVSIQGHGWASIAPVSGNPAITINANPGDKINIIGVVLDGTALPTTSGIVFNSGGSLTVRDSVIRNFMGVGINFVPNSSFLSRLFVSNTLVSDSFTGIRVAPTGSGTTSGVLDHVQMENNMFEGLFALATDQPTNMTVSESVSANNLGSGIVAQSTAGTLINIMVRNSTSANNVVGLGANGTGAAIRVTRSTMTGNNFGWAVSGPGAGVVTSYGDNNIDGNGANNTEPPGPLVYH